MNVNLSMVTSNTTHRCTALKSANKDISTANTTNIDVILNNAGDLLSFLLKFSRYVQGDYISAIKVLDSAGTTVRHIIYSGSAAGNYLYVPSGLIYRFAPQSGIYKDFVAGDILRVTYVSTTTNSVNVAVDVEVGQDVQTS